MRHKYAEISFAVSKSFRILEEIIQANRILFYMNELFNHAIASKMHDRYYLSDKLNCLLSQKGTLYLGIFYTQKFKSK